MMPYKLIAGLVIVAAILAGTYAGGYRAAESKLQPVINQRDAQLLAIDLKAKEDIIKYQENLDAIQDKSKRDRADITAYYKRLYEKLRKDNLSTGTIAIGTESVDGTTVQSPLTGCSLTVEQRCVEDALRVQQVTEFFRVNKFPVSQE